MNILDDNIKKKLQMHRLRKKITKNNEKGISTHNRPKFNGTI